MRKWNRWSAAPSIEANVERPFEGKDREAYAGGLNAAAATNGAGCDSGVLLGPDLANPRDDNLLKQSTGFLGFLSIGSHCAIEQHDLRRHAS